MPAAGQHRFRGLCGQGLCGQPRCGGQGPAPAHQGAAGAQLRSRQLPEIFFKSSFAPSPSSCLSSSPSPFSRADASKEVGQLRRRNPLGCLAPARTCFETVRIAAAILTVSKQVRTGARQSETLPHPWTTQLPPLLQAANHVYIATLQEGCATAHSPWCLLLW
jgi:hypothetical protein